MKRLIAAVLMVIVMLSNFVFVSAAERMVSTADFSYKTFEAVSGRATISFDINANTVSDGFVGIASSTVVPKNYSDYAICFRIRTDGSFDANNGSSFDKATEVKYAVNTTYHVEIDADIMNQIYNAYVYAHGEKHIIADNYAFRASALDLGKITARGGANVASGLYYIENIEAIQGEGEFETFVLPNFFAENMVLQRNEKHKVFGRGEGEITVSLSNGVVTSKTTVVAENGEFEAYLDPLPASLTPYTLTVSARDKTQIIENVFVGDVYLLAGQSNMAQTYEHLTGEQLGNGVTTSNMPQMITDERIKFFKLSRTPASEEAFNVPFETDKWQPLNDDTKKKLSYIGMFFAEQRLKEEPDVPVGLMCVAWRGTTINRWMRKSDENKTVNYTPTNGDIYNNHVAPLVGYPVSAVLWYQGESDAGNPVMYEEAFKTLISDWRRLWNDEDMPFLFVQLARYGKDTYQYLRDAQLKALSLPNTGMVVSIDTDKGTYNNIHPLGKETIAERLHLLAKKYVYNRETVASGPIFESARAEGSKIIVSFKEDTIGDGLEVNNPYGATTKALSEFEVASRYGAFTPATAVINEDNTVTVSASSVKEPVYVRYAYSAVPNNPNLYNKNGLPASPFTTDVRHFSTDSFSSVGYEAENGDIQIAELTVCPVKAPINGVIGITDSNNTVTAWNSCGITISMNADGVFQLIDGGNWIMTDITYEKDTLYNIKVTANFKTKTYTAEINGKIACENASFRSGALEMNNLGRVMLRGGYGEAGGEFYGLNYRVHTPKVIISALEKGEGEVKVTLEAFSEADKEVYGVSYKDDAMTGFERGIPGENEGEYILPLNGEADKTKVIVFDMENIEPLCEYKIVE
ncbi:MAG: hypothetical protein IJO83_03485 [Clostridia bacterium]|nr:hypothetical protein [Clostridia bacterium]